MSRRKTLTKNEAFDQIKAAGLRACLEPGQALTLATSLASPAVVSIAGGVNYVTVRYKPSDFYMSSSDVRNLMMAGIVIEVSWNPVSKTIEIFAKRGR